MKLQLKRSNVLELGAAKEPTAVQMEYGELAVNYNNGDPAIFLKDSNDNIIRIAGTGNINSGDNPSGDTLPPTGNNVGDMFFKTTNNTMYYWDGSEWVPIANDVTAADIFVGTITEINAEVPVADRRNGFLWWNTEDGTLYIWYIDANTSQFVIAIPAGPGGDGGANVAVLPTPPTTPNQGDMWWNTNDGRLYIYYTDVDSSQWIDASPDSQVSPITSGETFPTDGLENDCFFNTTDGRLYIYYDDGTSLQWVDASPDSQGAVYWNRVSGALVPTSDTDDVNIGSGNITLNADGSITAAGKGEIGSSTETGTIFKVRGQGTNVGEYNIACYSDAGTVFSVARDGSIGCGGLGSAAPVFIAADGSATFTNDSNTEHKVEIKNNPAAGQFISMYKSATDFSNYLARRISWLNGSAYLIADSSNKGVQLSANATAWTTFTSESRLKDIVGDPNSDECWNLIRDIELKRYFYSDQSDEVKSGVSYMGPMADWLEEQDPELVIYQEPDEEGPIRTFNQALLDMKALQALSTALTRIEALEAEVQSLKEGN